MPNTEQLVQRAQKRGINISQAEDQSWHGSYIWEGEEYTLDNPQPEALVDDMEALVEILAQDDTYNLEYNEDLDRYVIDVQGEEEQFSDQVLAKAFQKAKSAVMSRLSKAEEERRKREAEAKPAEPIFDPKPAGRRKTASNGPTEAPESLGGSPPPPQLAGIEQAITRLLDAITERIRGGAEIPQIAEPVAPPPPPPPAPKRKGLTKKA